MTTIARSSAVLLIAIVLIAAGCNSSGASADASGTAGAGGHAGSGGVSGSAGTGPSGSAGGGASGTAGTTASGTAGGGAGGMSGRDGTTGGGGVTGGGGSNGGAGTTGSGGTTGGGGSTAGTGGTGGGQSTGCSGTCQLGTYCTGCGNGGTKKLACSCYMDSAGVGRWSCGSRGACGSNGCGPTGTCDPHYDTACEACDGAGARRRCTCGPGGSGVQGIWSCASSSGTCGVACGDHRCLTGEICVRLGQYGGFPVDGGIGEPTLAPTCTVVPDACGNQAPSCAACIISAFGCSLPGVCRDVGPQTFDCILGGA